ncbi:kelch-like protein 26 [Coccinella septempunctata]|uniref:kelch-like protein 26 n=1 Tax=Coccinella septempunctata TaxID=41139 RepID=UPI001D063074|nr:kelch-like protein 26 [Coccinella septempunctata]
MRQSLYDNPLFSVIYDYPSHQGIVLDGLNTLRKREELIDVTLIVQGQAFKAHKVVLSACSDYFRAMFTDNMIEAHRKEIRLNGMNAKGFLLVLEYAYTCRITLNLSNVQDVLEAASHVQMLALIQTCSNYLEAEIDIDNCVDIATISETYSLTALKMEVYRFMNENLSSFSKTGEFYRLSSCQLETLLAYDLPVDCSEYEVLKVVVNWFFYNTNTRSKLDISQAAQIFRHVHFSDIPRKRLHTILQEINENNNCVWELYRIVVSEIYNQLSTKDSKILTNLLNPRGLELAVVKIGGFGVGGITNEITYKFSSRSKWKHLTKIPHVEQCNFGTAVLNNDLFVIGGCFNQFMQENVHPFGFKYNTLHNKWTTLSPMKVERCRFSLNVVEGKMYAVGGVTEVEEFGSNVTCTCECYDPASDEWTMIEPLPIYLTQHGGATYEQTTTSKLFICGGIERDSTHCQNSMYCYDLQADKWTPCAPMLTPRADHVVLSIDNFLYVCGGWQEDIETGARTLVDTIDVYDVEKDCWSVKTRVPTPRFHAGIVSIFRKIYFIGGFHCDAMFDKNTAAIECYDIENDFWSTENKYPEDIWEHTCALLYIPKCRNGMDVISQSTDIS